MTMQLFSTVTVGSSGASSIDWTSIPQTGKDLYVVLSWDGTSNGSFELDVQMNGTTNTARRLFGTGTTVSSVAADQISIMDSDYPATNTFHSLSLYVPDYTKSAQHEFLSDSVVESNSTQNYGSYQVIVAGKNSSTSAITSLSFVSGYLLFAQYTTASLYIVS